VPVAVRVGAGARATLVTRLEPVMNLLPVAQNPAIFGIQKAAVLVFVRQKMLEISGYFESG
jgi:hypothetical protein